MDIFAIMKQIIVKGLIRLKRLFKAMILIVLLLIIQTGFSANAEAAKIMWGKTELKAGQIGKVTILSDTISHELDMDNELNHDRVLKKGEEYRVYSYRSDIYGGSYGLGDGIYVIKYSAIKYETPSKYKLSLLDQQNENVVNNLWGKILLKDGYNAKVVIKNPTYLFSNNNLTRLLDVGEEYRIHGTSSEPWKVDLGASTYVEKADVEIKELWMFHQMEWKIGQKGLITILHPTTLVKFDELTGEISTIRNLMVGEKYRVYGLKSSQNEFYDVGGGYYVASDVKISYVTPSKDFLYTVENRLNK